MLALLTALIAACGPPSPPAGPQLTWSAISLDDISWHDALELTAPPSNEDLVWHEAHTVSRTETLSRSTGVRWLRTRRPLSNAERGAETTGYLSLQGRARLFVGGQEVARVEPRTAGPQSGSFGSVRRFAFRWPDRQEVDLHVLYAETFPDGLEWFRPRSGFLLLTGSAAVTEKALTADQRQIVRQQTGLATLFAAQALVHLLLFLFYRRIRSNLWFSMTAFLSAVMVALQLQRALVEDVALLGPIYQAWNVAYFLTMVLLLRFSHEVFDRKLGRVFWATTIVGVLGAVMSLLLEPFDAFTGTSLWALVVLLSSVRAAFRAWREGWSGAWILLIGFGLLTAGLVAQRLLISGLWQSTPWPVFPVAYYGVAGLLVTTSVYLAFHFSRAITRLREQVDEIEELSRRNLEQQLSAMELATEQRLLEADNRRKTEELDQARRLQLALLPRRLPELEDLEIAVSMDTASEVGGDYYDFQLHAEHGLTIAIGDAAGHGARAGSTVSLVKGLFTNMGASAGDERDLPTLLERTNHRLRNLAIARLQMALTMVRVRGDELTFAAAGMPQPLLWRAASGTVEEIEVSGLPLGALDNVRYTQELRRWQSGDVLLLMSDGLPEMQRADGSLVGYEEVARRFTSFAHLGPAGLIERLRADSQEHSGGHLADDVTFVALRRCDDQTNRSH